ncbi:MAG: DUF47 family protein [Thaumarchaeota archaeon]|nr:DUF47 family protein [Nitrososphaerota archaeon]MCY3975524.1 DUF47 family protein [Nitrososphaerota archaeon]
MYSGELEIQAKRKAIAILQDEINRILNATRELVGLPDFIIKKDKSSMKNTLEQITNIEEEVENLRKKITREISDVGGLVIDRENLLNTAYMMDEIGEHITDIAFKLSNLKPNTLKILKLQNDLTKFIELIVDEVYKLNEIVRNLNTNSNNAIELSYEIQSIEREIHSKYRQLTIKIVNEITNMKELLLFKDAVDEISTMSDKCQHISDLFVLLALS